MKKILSLLMLLMAVVIGARAEEAIIYYAVDSDANSITVNGFTLTITGNSGKKWSSGGKMKVNGKDYKALKNANWQQNTLVAPAGKVIKEVKFYVTTNATDGCGVLTEFEGRICSDIVTTQKKYGTECDVITKTLATPANSVTFKFEKKQVFFVALVTYEDAPSDYVATPAISVSGATVTITCGTSDAKIFYTTDGIEPTSASTKYSSAITLTESATVRAIAIKGEQKSEETSKDVYVAGKGALATLGSKGGILNGDKNVWTSTDGKFTLTDKSAGRKIDAVTLSASSDGFKLNHGDEYVLQPAADIKVTKIVVVGKTWLPGKAGNASSISITGFTPESGTFYDYPEGGSTYVKTLTFTADETVGYGTAIPLKISNNQLGAYIEVYGEETATTYDNGWVSFTPSFDCAVTTEGAAAYIATKVAGSNVTMTKVEKMKAGNGYFLYAGSSEVKDLTVEIAEGATAPAENLIVGCTAATNVDGAANSIYCLGKLNGAAGLYKVSTSLEVPAGKAYLQAPLALKASVLNLVFSDSSETTAVKGICTQAEKNEAAIGTKHIINGKIVIKTQNGYMNLMGVQVK